MVKICLGYLVLGSYRGLWLLVALWAFLCFRDTAVAGVSKPLMSYSAKLHDDTKWADGDSFMVVLEDQGESRDEVIRLYYVDCPETVAVGDSGKRRVRAQFRYFGLEKGMDAIEVGMLAKHRVAELLQKPFTVHTAGSRAMGRSKKPRIYGMITLSDGRDLAAVLVQEGLARVYGVKKTRPDGTKTGEYDAYLKDLELSAAVQKRGAWSKSDPARLVELRAKERQEARDLDNVLEGGVFSSLTEENPMDLNLASVEELKQLRGIGDTIAKRIIDGRPYKKREDLKMIKGIGEATFKKIKNYVKVE